MFVVIVLHVRRHGEEEKMQNFSGLIERYQHDCSNEMLEKMQNEVEILRTKTDLDLRNCKGELEMKNCEIEKIEHTLELNKVHIEKLEQEIKGIEEVIKTLLAEAAKYDAEAAGLDSQATTSSKIGWTAVALGVTGLALTPFTGGLSAALLGIAAPAGATGVAAVAFVDAADKREAANNKRKSAEYERSNVNRKRLQITRHQEIIDKDLIEKNNLHHAIHNLQAEIGDLENMHANLSAFEFLVGIKISQKHSISASHVSQHTSTQVPEGSISENVDKELDEILQNLETASSSAKSSGKHNKEYVTETLPWIIHRTRMVKSAMSSQYKSILNRKEMDFDDQETMDLKRFLESTHNEITDLKQNIGDDMISRINNIMKEQTVLKRLHNEVQVFKQDISEMKKRLEALQKDESQFTYEANELEKMASDKNKEKDDKVKVGAGGVGVLAVSALAVPLTGGASLVLAGASGAVAAYNLLSAYECSKIAEQKTEQAKQTRKQAEHVQWEITKTNNEKRTRKNQMKNTNDLIVQLKADQEILQNILNQLMKFTDVVNGILVVLQFQKKV